jgi:L-methionine (R)-S-oxide reductase
MQSDQVRREIDELAKKASSATDLMDAITRKLNERMLKYNWVGFYMISKSDPNVLELGPFVGAMTPHTRIPLNQGICGAAASKGSTVVVDDVSQDARYLACSQETKSEIVVPIFVHNKVVGELDIDSHFLSAFSRDDQSLVEYCAQAVGRYLEKRLALAK